MSVDRRSSTATFTPRSAPVSARAEPGGRNRRGGRRESGARQPADLTVLRALDCLYGDTEQD